MTDKILENFLMTQNAEAAALAEGSDILDLHPGPGDPPAAWVAVFHCTGLVRMPGGRIEEADEFHAGIHFGREYLRRVDPMVVTILKPLNCWYPNVLGPGICVGDITPGTSLVTILHQVHDILTYNNWASHDGINPDACKWARRSENQERFPTDRRPLKANAAAVDPSAPPLAELIEVTEA